MVFNWKASAPLDVDFHTVPEGKPISASETFMRGTASSGQGTYRAPYPGLHGWYWKNAGKEDVKIVLNASGFFTEARMFSGDPVGEADGSAGPAAAAIVGSRSSALTARQSGPNISWISGHSEKPIQPAADRHTHPERERNGSDCLRHPRRQASLVGAPPPAGAALP